MALYRRNGRVSLIYAEKIEKVETEHDEKSTMSFFLEPDLVEPIVGSYHSIQTTR